MKLDRNINPDGRGKYALVLLRETPENTYDRLAARDAMDVIQDFGMLDYGDDADSEFFVIRLKDKYAAAALHAYAVAADCDGQKEWASEVFGLVLKAENNPSKKQPD